mmetsp:Transcript_43762/g.171229  ORF Transcript_43762/g.171229 Transcript_43762/m.171229 type:complete len:253 (-) Transcript_43762:665-1423(-)
MAQADDNQSTSLGPEEAFHVENLELGEVLREFHVLSDVFETGQQRLSVLAGCLQKLGHKHGILPVKSSSESQQVATSEPCRAVDRATYASSPLQQESNELTKLGDDVMEMDIFNDCSAALEQEPNPDDMGLKGRTQPPPPSYVPQEFSSISTERTSMTSPSLNANLTSENRSRIKRVDNNACLCCLLPVNIFEHAFSMPCCTGNAHLSCVIRTIEMRCTAKRCPRCQQPFSNSLMENVDRQRRLLKKMCKAH